MSKLLYTIHQPNFLPWLGFFDKVYQADCFIFFDHVQRPRGKSWLSRVKVNCLGKEKWLTLPIVKKGHSIERISETQIKHPEENFQSLQEKVKNYYRQAPYYRETANFLSEIIQSKPVTLCDFNIEFITQLSQKLGFETTFHRSSTQMSLLQSDAKQTEMIIETCQAFKVSNYLSGRGASFLEPERFKEVNIKLNFQNFTHPIYSQGKGQNFLAGLSIIDTLAYLGLQGTRHLFL